MNYRSPLYCSPLFFILSACNTNALQTATAEENLVSVPQIQIATTEIRCQDIQNPAYQQMIINAINEIRQQGRQCGKQYFADVAPLKWNQNLYDSAVAHTKDMASHAFLGHISTTGLDLKARLKQYGFKGKGGGENVARGQKNLNEVMATWLASSLHCSNLMHPKFTDYAVACSLDQTAKQKSYWTQQFGVR